MAYDTSGGKIYWLGCDHAQSQMFIQYDENTNAWSALTAPPFAAPSIHGYEHTTFDTTHGKLYHRRGGTKGVYRWDGGGSWTFIDYWAYLGYSSAANGCAFFPDLGTNGSVMVFQVENGTDGELIGLDPVTLGIKTYASGSTLAGTGDPHNFAQYTPTHKYVVFGGGNDSRRIWRINSSGVVTQLSDIPAALRTMGPATGNSLLVCNPANGNFIAIASSSVWYDFDPRGSGTWTARSGTAQAWTANVFDSSQPLFGTIACPVQQYGVIVFIKAYNGSSPAQMWLFKP